jgi:hypothetical protein
MLEKITSAHLNKRLLICPQITRIGLTEVLVLEISPSGKNVKIHNLITDTKYWQSVEEWVIVDLLPDTLLALELDNPRIPGDERIKC